MISLIFGVVEPAICLFRLGPKTWELRHKIFIRGRGDVGRGSVEISCKSAEDVGRGEGLKLTEDGTVDCI